MNFAELNTRIFRKEPVSQVLWQPRLEHWYNVNKREKTLPERYRDMSLLEVFDDLNCSVRPYWAFNSCIQIKDDPSVWQEHETQGERDITVTHTPAGDLVSVQKRASLSHHPEKYPVVTAEDMKVMEWILTHRTVTFDYEQYRQACVLIGERAAPSIYISRVNVMRLIIEFMGFENGLRALFEMPKETEHLLRTINETDDLLLDVVCESPIEIVNFGDNVHQMLCPPPIFEKWVMPEYIRRNEILHSAGKKTYPHWDGDCKQLLVYVRDCGFDGYEALTPLPQGDVTLEEIRDAFGDELILLDGIPCTDFLPTEPLDGLMERTRKCIEYFHPRLVLGISDELSPVGDIERVRLVSEIVREYETHNT